MAKDQFQVTFKGVRGSIPTPMSSDEIREKIFHALERVEPKDLEDERTRRDFINRLPVHIGGCYGGNSSCVHIAADGQHLIFDAGSGLRELGRSLMTGEFGKGQGRAHIFISHTHWDHILGLPFFAPIYVAGNKFTFYGVHGDLEERLRGQQEFKYFPVSFDIFAADIDFVDLSEKPEFEIGDAVLSWRENDHPGRSFAFRVDFAGKSVIYATDSEYKKIGPNDLKPVIEFFKDADILIFDSQYTFMEGIELKEDWGHSSTFIGIDIALEANIKKLAFYHHEPTYTDFKLLDILHQSKKYLKAVNPKSELEMFFAYEGQIIDLLKEE